LAFLVISNLHPPIWSLAQFSHFSIRLTLIVPQLLLFGSVLRFLELLASIYFSLIAFSFEPLLSFGYCQTVPLDFVVYNLIRILIIKIPNLYYLLLSLGNYNILTDS